jgi:hypothetical protein
MPRAVLKNGVVYPIEPLPPGWGDGTELQLEKSPPGANGSSGQSTDQWMDEVEALASKIPTGEDDKLAAAVRQLRRQAKR